MVPRQTIPSLHEILVWIRIRGSIPLTNGVDPDPSIFVSDLQDINKKLIFLSTFFGLLLFEGTHYIYIYIILQR
jgi:hypothetical protein